jgi:hypothetical protein
MFTEDLDLETQETIKLRNEVRSKLLKILSTEEEIQETIIDKISEEKVTDSKEITKIVQIVFKEILEKIVWTAFEKVEKKIHPQVVAIFLFSKSDGHVKRYKIWGFDKNNNLIDEKSFLPDEEYEEGEGFTGMTLVKPFGQPHYCNSLDLPDMMKKLKFGQDYKEKLGFLKCSIAVPLYSTHRIFGLIRVFNKIDPRTKEPSKTLEFDQREVFWLTILGGHISDAMSRLRRKQEDRIKAELIRMTKATDTSKIDIYSFITRQLIGELTPYKVCVLRIRDGNSFPITGKIAATDDIEVSSKEKTSRNLQENCIVGEVGRTGNYLKIEDINLEKEKFISFPWISENKLRSFICFPLEFQGSVIGTISLFTGYLHIFNDSDIDFLRQISNLLSTYIGLVRLQSSQQGSLHSKNLESESESESEDYNTSVIHPYSSDELRLVDKDEEARLILGDLKKKLESIEELETHGKLSQRSNQRDNLQDGKVKNSFRTQPIQPIEGKTTQILKAIQKYHLNIQNLAYTISESNERTQRIVQELWEKGYIDYLSSPIIFVLLPGLRKLSYRQRLVKPLTCLTLTSKGYFHLYPVVQFNKPLTYA